MKNLIGYEWRDASDGKIIEVTNPATNELIDTVPNCSSDDVNEAVRVAEAEQKKWFEIPLHERAEKIYKFISLVERDKDILAKLFSGTTIVSNISSSTINVTSYL